MRWLLIAVAVAGLTLVGACSLHDGVPASSIALYNATNDVLISTTNTKGAITVMNGDDYHFKVVRLVRDGTGTSNSNVTPFCWFVFDTPGIATANSLGVIHGDSPGTTTLEVKFRPTASDPIDHCWLDVTVSD